MWKRILTGKIAGIEDEYYKAGNEYIPCAIVWYEDIKVLIPSTHLGTKKLSKSMIRGMLNAEIDFIIIEIDEIANIATVRVRIIGVGIKYIIVELYGKEVTIKAENLQHIFIMDCKQIYSPGEYLKVRIKNIDIQNDIYELSSKEFVENPYKSIRKYITENGEYTGIVTAFPKSSSGIIVQLDITKISCFVRVPAMFDNYPHYLEKVLVKVTDIYEDKKQIYGYLMRIL